jgi:hypothetical protein
MSKLSERLGNVFGPSRDDNDWCHTLQPRDPLSVLFQSVRRATSGLGATSPSESQRQSEQSIEAMPDLRETAADTRPEQQRARREDGRG